MIFPQKAWQFSNNKKETLEGYDHLYYSTVNIFLMSLNFSFLYSAQLKDASTSPLCISTQKRIHNGNKVSKPVTGGRHVGKMSKQKFQDLQRQVNCQMCFCYLSVDIFQRSYVLTKNIRKVISFIVVAFNVKFSNWLNYDNCSPHLTKQTFSFYLCSINELGFATWEAFFWKSLRLLYWLLL